MEGTILWPLFDDIGELISNQGLASVNTSRNWIHFPIAQYIYIERLTYRIECCMGTNTNFLLQPNDKVYDQIVCKTAALFSMVKSI